MKGDGDKPMSITEHAKHKFKYAEIGKCQDHRCLLRLDGLSNYVRLKGERLSEDEKICDCIIFIHKENIILVIAELKGKNPKAGEIVEKLEACLTQALKILESCPIRGVGGGNIDFYPVLLAESYRQPEYKLIASRRITFNGKRYNIIIKKCGEYLNKIIDEF